MILVELFVLWLGVMSWLEDRRVGEVGWVSMGVVVGCLILVVCSVSVG